MKEKIELKEKIEYYLVLSIVLVCILMFMIYNCIETDKLVDEYYQQVIKNEIIK